ncbi:MAG: PEP-CTERM sorting domain-containing protein [Planctomycetes bacterium]|nr:PEP-CTERM sorting domain-containing protein [Planctomycetota bacterium]
MKFYSYFNMFTKSVALLALVAMSLAPAITNAGTFSWGDIAGTNVTFLDVTENNGGASSLFAPMPGMGGPIAIGDILHLDPQGFASQSANNSADIIDSQLSTTIMAGSGSSIEDITITELGDYSLGGLTGGQASAQVGAAFFWTILEIDNTAVSMATQATNLILGTGGGPNGGIYSRPSDDGTAVIWSGTASIDLGSYLDSLQIDGDVTKVRLTFDNTLQTSADDVSTAFIKKKSVDIEVNTETTIPEPTTALLLGLGIALVPCCRRRSL